MKKRNIQDKISQLT